MAEIAIGANCSACGTLVACAGSYSDERLTGVCPVCKIAVTTANHEYVAPPQEPAAEIADDEPAQEPVPFEPTQEPAVDNPVMDEDDDA